MMIRPVNAADAPAICGIYNYYIANTAISFEETPVSAAEMEDRIRTVTAKYPWFVREEAGEVLAYAYVNTWKERIAYRYAAELSIYVKYGKEGRGFGKKLMTRLLEAVKKTEIHALVSGITMPNDRSVALHEKFGFQKIAQFNEIGFKLDKWLDVGYWELVIKREA
ncbi:MAG: GNAT family N-acetyltransferase [Treponema sp.]|jgi:phosphinothricin acetyltransferase|nr:GNAT family N-acetyltransferase [Treponema sp.]